MLHVTKKPIHNRREYPHENADNHKAQNPDGNKGAEIGKEFRSTILNKALPIFLLTESPAHMVRSTGSKVPVTLADFPDVFGEGAKEMHHPPYAQNEQNGEEQKI